MKAVMNVSSLLASFEGMSMIYGANHNNVIHHLINATQIMMILGLGIYHQRILQAMQLCSVAHYSLAIRL